MHCVDTDFLVAVLKGSEDVRKKAEELDALEFVATTAMSAFELYVGAFLSKKRKYHLKDVEKLLARFENLPLDERAAKKAGEIYAKSVDRGIMVDIRDAIIAGIAMSNGYSIVTRNDEHFRRVKGLEVEKW